MFGSGVGVGSDSEDDPIDWDALGREAEASKDEQLVLLLVL